MTTIGAELQTDLPLTIGGRSFRSRLMVGTGKYRSNEVMARAIEASGAEIVTVAVRRVDLDRTKAEGILYHLSGDEYFLPEVELVPYPVRDDRPHARSWLADWLPLLLVPFLYAELPYLIGVGAVLRDPLVQVRDDDVMTGRTAIISGIPGLELTQTDGRAILDAVAEEGETVNVTLTVELADDDIRTLGEGSGGLGVFDITDPFDWKPMYRIQTGMGGVHNFAFHPTADVGYVWTGALPGVIDSIPIIDFRDLDNPEVLPAPATLGGPHDGELNADGSRIYVASENNYQIYDNTDPFDPQLISMAPNVGSYAHGVFPSPDGQIMVTNNESLVLGGFFVAGTGVCPGEGLAAYNISNEQTPIGPVGYYVPNVAGPVGPEDDRPCTSHFGRFAPGTRILSMGWYIGGVRIIDWTNPSLPVEVAGAVLEGTNTWAAKFHKGPYIYAGDIGRGFDAFRWSG
jgi:hypothetical protein